MDILEATVRAIGEARAKRRPEQATGSAIVMHPAQHRELSDHKKVVEASQAPPGYMPRLKELEGLPTWLFDGVVGPAVVDARTLMMLKMLGARKV